MNERTSIASNSEKTFWRTKGAALLWLALALGPLAWSLDVEISYPMVKWECGNHVTWPLHLVSIACALVAVAGWLTSYWCYRGLPADATVDGGTAFDRSHFMAIGGLALNAMFFLVIVANAVPRFLIGPCQQ